MRNSTWHRHLACALGLTALAACSDAGGRAGEAPVRAVASPLAWLPTAEMRVPRGGNTATLLPSGEVLLTGGIHIGAGILEPAAELYDPSTGQFRAAATMNEPRTNHTAALLHDGRVLLVGGFTGLASQTTASTAEIYDPATDTFHTLPGTVDPLPDASAVVLASGEVLVTGKGPALLFDPVKDSFRSIAHAAWRISHTSTLLPSGRVLIAGGWMGAKSATSEAEEFDPAAGSFTPVGSMAYPRELHSATRLPSGDVLVVGGLPDGALDAQAEIYHPDTKTFSAAGPTALARHDHGATLLPSGKVLLFGGSPSASSPALAELFDPSSSTFVSIPHPTDACWSFVRPVVLASGKVLFAGGCAAPSSELFDPEAAGESASFKSLDAPPIQRAHHTATLLLSGKVLLAGGEDGGTAKDEAFLFDPSSAGKLTPLGAKMTAARAFHTATLLPSGRVLLAGGRDEAGVTLSSTEVFDPATGAFAPAAPLATAREAHTASLLFSGELLLVGGLDGAHASLLSAELLDPRTDTVRPAGALHIARASHTATPLPSGEILVAGGAQDAEDAEVFDPLAKGGAGQFRTLASKPASGARIGGTTATLLPSGKVLVIGLGPFTSRGFDVFDPAGAGEFSRFVGMTYVRSGHTATLLPSGKILVAGGTDAGADTPSPPLTELYDPLGDPMKGSFTATAEGVGPRLGHTATLLPSGKVLVVGGGTPDMAFAGLWSDGAIGDDAFRPALGKLSGAAVAGGSVTLDGAGLLGIADANGGSRGRASSDAPLALFLPSAGGYLTGALAPWSDGAATWSIPTTALVGPGLFFVVSSGIPSLAQPMVLGTGLGTPCNAAGPCAQGVCVDGTCCDTPCGDCAFACTAAKKGAGLDGHCGPITRVGEGCCTSSLDCAGEEVCDADGRCRRPLAPSETGGCSSHGSPPGPWLASLVALAAAAALRSRSPRRSRAPRG